MDYFFGDTERMREVESRAELIARSHVPILIEGETGTGKERLARYLYERRPTGGQLVRILCDSSPADAIRAATEDTLLLKRVDRLGLPAQEQILPQLDEIRGGYPFLISTTSRSLEHLAAEGRFLPELLYRISVYRISLPPLRDRRADIPALFRLMHAEIAGDGAPEPMPASRSMEALMSYSWPGNLRELQNVVRQYLLAPDSAVLQAEMEKRRHATSAKPVLTTLKERVKQESKRVETEIILQVLEQHRWNRRRTAEALNISYRSLMYKMKNCNIRGENGLRRSVAQG
ncbi:MAG TPA: sigma 54-interacting transcriptional regulator [Candidatus Acidoferrales bacterium]|nr:sigma 54-interacting transcriptional regulator [Candidatus Acidoferrales bacterium]